MATSTMRVAAGVLLVVSALATLARAEDPYLFFEWKVTYGTRSLLGVPQKVILINGEFPGPRINCSSNNNIVVNVFNQLDHPLLFTWNGMQHRKNSWMDGMPGTQCPIAPNTNFTYKWQPKDQIGSFFYFPVNGPLHVIPNVITAEFRTFIEIVFENPEKSIDSLHLDGYAFFGVGMGPGTWSPEMRKTYNLLDTVSRHTIQVYPRSWTAIMLTFDNAGMWSVRSNVWERYYLGEQFYISVISPARSLRDEYNMPDNALRCGKVVGLPLPPSYAPAR
ncbi:SKU5 similar 13 [Zea mays]|uniref:SKU5 similar 13 n=1 Tax=Zea mays TaxID=4577 RepID=A0A1D6FSI4_MAIZE|nr:SKU5 similar 13 [Zea mays]